MAAKMRNTRHQCQPAVTPSGLFSRGSSSPAPSTGKRRLYCTSRHLAGFNPLTRPSPRKTESRDIEINNNCLDFLAPSKKPNKKNKNK